MKLSDWQDLLADPNLHWKAGYSAMAAAQSWQSASSLPSEIGSILGEGAELLAAFPEFKVALPGGRRESQCDIFALVRCGEDTCALAVEAKVNEPFGPTIAEWNPDSTAGRRERLDAIKTLLGLQSDPPGHLRYQLFHRTAAAILCAQRFKTDHAAMIVQSFSPDGKWFDDFSAFVTFLGLPPETGRAMHFALPTGQQLTLGWAKGDPRFLAYPAG
jgi:hypothetical protein